MEIRNRSNGFITTDFELRRSNPNISFPQVITVDVLNDLGYDPVFEGPQANAVAPYQYSQRDGIVEIDGKWYTKYIVGPVFNDYVDEQGVTHTAAEQYEQHCFVIDQKQGEAVRLERNKLLAASDWTQLDDSPFDVVTKANWASYRELLRQVPEQTTFPWDVEWPVQPS